MLGLHPAGLPWLTACLIFVARPSQHVPTAARTPLMSIWLTCPLTRGPSAELQWTVDQGIPCLLHLSICQEPKKPLISG